jgi:hypothetical protein
MDRDEPGFKAMCEKNGDPLLKDEQWETWGLVFSGIWIGVLGLSLLTVAYFWVW